LAAVSNLAFRLLIGKIRESRKRPRPGKTHDASPAQRQPREFVPVTTLFLSHSSYLDHDTGPGHPENSDRVRAITTALEGERFSALIRADVPGLDRAATLRVHAAHYLDAIEAATPNRGRVHLDPDTVMSAQSIGAIGHCVGAATAAVDEVMRRGAKNAFIALRPPGHHAGIASPMGFCFFNNAAIAARHAQAAHGAERVAILDFDVHHGNGTQEIFWSDRSVLYASTHQMPLFPGTGARDERGEHDTIVNAPLTAGDYGAVFREAMETRLLPRIDAFRPDLLVVSAGFDAHRLDPLGGLNLVEADFAWATTRLMEIAEIHAKGRIVSVLEGGYHLEGLARSAAAHVAALMGA
jgi:acetoin utilization deacetylase AcuC-like enzyme